MFQIRRQVHREPCLGVWAASSSLVLPSMGLCAQKTPPPPPPSRKCTFQLWAAAGVPSPPNTPGHSDRCRLRSCGPIRTNQTLSLGLLHLRPRGGVSDPRAEKTCSPRAAHSHVPGGGERRSAGERSVGGRRRGRDSLMKAPALGNSYIPALPRFGGLGIKSPVAQMFTLDFSHLRPTDTRVRPDGWSQAQPGCLLGHGTCPSVRKAAFARKSQGLTLLTDQIPLLGSATRDPEGTGGSTGREVALRGPELPGLLPAQATVKLPLQPCASPRLCALPWPTQLLLSFFYCQVTSLQAAL